MRTIRVLTSGLLRALGRLLVLAAAATPIHGACAASNGIGGTGATASHGDNNGIGGTGAVANGSGDSGIGGTGAVAEGSGIGGTGIVGTITAFGSIFVNGVEIHYSAKTPVQADGHAVPISRLAIGQVVAVDASITGTRTHARSMRIVHAVEGPITRIDSDHGRFHVLGQTVALHRHTPIIGLPSPAETGTRLHIGDYVEVSGLRRSDGVIVASLIRRTPSRVQVSVSGPVTATGPSGLRIYGLLVHPGNLSARAIADGTLIRVNGNFEQGRLRAARVDIEPSVPFGGRLPHLRLEGYVHARQGSEELRIGHVEVQLTDATRFAGGNAQALTVDRRVQVSVHLNGNRRLVADRIVFETGRPDTDRSAVNPTQSRKNNRREDINNEDQNGHFDTNSERPTVEAPEVERPDFEAPEIERPDISLPEVETSD